MIDPEFGHWLAGFADGEGCFHIKRINGHGTRHFVCCFSIALRDDDREILDEIAARTGLGDVRSYAYQSAKDSRGFVKNPQALWEVGRKADVAGLVELFDRYPLRAKKARDYAIWRDAVRAWMGLRKGNRWHGRSKVTEQLAAYKMALEEARVYGAVDCPLDEDLDQLCLDVA